MVHVLETLGAEGPLAHRASSPGSAGNSARGADDEEQTEGVPPPRQLLVTGAALLTAGLLVATAWMSVFGVASEDFTSFTEHRLPPVVMLAVTACAAVVPLGILALAHDGVAAMGLTLAGIAAVLPLWAAWPDLDPRLRTLALAVGPLTAAGLALVVRSWAAVAISIAAGLAHAAAYDPFRDTGCARVCLEVPPVLAIPTAHLTLTLALAMSVASVFVLSSARGRGGLAAAAAAGALALAVIAVLRWRTTGDGGAYGELLLAAVPIPGLVALFAVAAWAEVVRRRSAVRQLADHLVADPEGLLRLGTRIDVSLLSAGQRLALRNAQLAAEAQARLTEVRESQRRVVASADAERRRIERDLHDGTQQRLVGVLIQLAGLGLDKVEMQVREVLAGLRSFSRGAFPPVLEDEGLEVALRELAATSDAQLLLDLRLDAPVPAECARAVYALVSRARSGTVEVGVSTSHDCLDVVIAGVAIADLDDVQDRFGALGGTLAVTADRIEGRLPCVW